MPVVFAQRGMTTLGKSLNVSQLSGRSLGKIPRCCQAGFASCSFFFFFFNNSKGIIPVNEERHSDPVPDSPEKGPQGSAWGSRHLDSWAGAPEVAGPLELIFQEGQVTCPSLHPYACLKQAAQVPEGAENAIGIVPPGVVQHPCLTVGKAWWPDPLSSCSCLTAMSPWF